MCFPCSSLSNPTKVLQLKANRDMEEVAGFFVQVHGEGANGMCYSYTAIICPSII